MRAVVQRVTNADVKIDGRVNGKIDNGLLVLLGVGNGDTEEDCCIYQGTRYTYRNRRIRCGYESITYK